MSILSQIGVIVLIICIVLILIRSNKTLEEVSKEGEHFVDEWDLRQQRKEERLEEKQNKKLMKKERRKLGGQQQMEQEEPEEDYYDWEENREENSHDNDDWEINDIWNQNDRKEQNENRFEEEMIGDSGYYRKREPDNVIPMNKYKGAGLTLVQLDERHQPLQRYRVTQFPYTIGRSTKNQLVLEDLCVARMHCQIIEQNGNYIMEDVGSANKLYTEGRVVERVKLSDHLRVYIGNVEFQVEMGVQRSNSTRLYQNTGEYYYK